MLSTPLDPQYDRRACAVLQSIATVEDVLRAPDVLRTAAVEPNGELIVSGWMPALATFCDDLDGTTLSISSLW